MSGVNALGALKQAALKSKEYIDKSYVNTLKGKSSGAIVALDDVSPLEHKVKVKLSSKNLLTYPFVHTTRTHSGITFTDNGDGTITANGTCTPAQGVPYAEFAVYKGSGEAVYGRLVLSGCPSGGSATTYHVIDSPTGQRDIGDGKVYEHYLNRADIRIRIYPGVTVENLVFKPMLIMSETGAVEPFTPYVADDTEVTLTVCGKNLFDGVLKETTIGPVYKRVELYLTAGVYTISFSNQVYWQSSNTGYSGKQIDYWFTFTIANSGIYWIQFRMAESSSTPWDDSTKIQIEAGATATAYEPYTEEIVTTTIAEGVELPSNAPNMTIFTDNAGVVVEAEYNKDSNIVFEKLTQAIISLGGNI